jgi:1,4-alpha-glucan branching enzyme
VRVLPPQARGRRVDFEFFAPRAASVCVAGAFNTAALQVMPLRKMATGEWRLRMVLEPGRYEYHFLADGQRRPDPTAAQQVTNLCGGVNSVLVVE